MEYWYTTYTSGLVRSGRHSNREDTDRTRTTQLMTTENSGDGPDDGQTRTTIEVDRQVWRQVRSEAVADGKNVSTKLQEILEEYFDDRESQ